MKKVLTLLLLGIVTLFTACSNNKSAVPVKEISSSSTTSDTPYKPPTYSKNENGGETVIISSHIATENSPSTSGSTSDIASDYVLEEDLGGVNILKYAGEGGKLTIPSVIHGQKVLKIDEHAFRGTDVTDVVIPGSIKTIETSAFRGCNALETLIVSEGVEVIEGYAFADCPNLAVVTLPDKIKEVNIGAFGACPQIIVTYRGLTFTAANIEELYDLF